MPSWKKVVMHGSSGSLASLTLPNLTSQNVLGTDANGKLVAGSVSGYTLPTASNSVLGGVKVGGTLSITNGVLSARTYTGATPAVPGETLGVNGIAGYVPAATAAQYNYFLRGDGTWVIPTNTVTRLRPNITTSYTAGDFMITGSGATTVGYSNGVFTISSTDNDTTYIAFRGSNASSAGTLGLVPAPAKGTQASYYLRADGSWQIPPDNNTTYSDATTSASGLMSSTDKSKLDGIASGANAYVLPIASSDGLGGIKVGSGLSIDENGILTAGAATRIGTDGTNYYSGNVQITGAGATTVTYDSERNLFTVSSTDTDTDTTYSAGTGLTLSGTTFSVTDGVYAPATVMQDTAPTGTAGKLWWETDTGILKIYSGSVWVDAVPMPDMNLYLTKAGGSITGDMSIGQTLTVTGNILAEAAISASGGNSGQWNAAYRWGNHADAGYAALSHNHDSVYLKIADTGSIIDYIVAAAPGTLDTLNEIAAAIGDDANFSASIASVIAGKADASHTHNYDNYLGWVISDRTNTSNIVSGSTLTIQGSGASSVSFDRNSNTLTISSTDTNTDTTYSTATSSTLGLVKIGYTANAKNYPVQLSSGQMYVNVPWTDSDTTYSVFTGANASEDGTTGLVVAPRVANRAQFLRGDGSWATPTDTNTTYSAGTGLTLSGTTFSVTANTYASASHTHDQIINNTDGGTFLVSNTAENNNWLFQENARGWGIFYFNKGTEKGQTFGDYTTVGAETFFIGQGSGTAMPSWTGRNASSKVTAMISNYDGTIWSAGNIQAAGNVKGAAVYDNGTRVSVSGHTHDDRYYTETEVNTLLAGKLGSTAKAADANLLDGNDSSYFYPASTGNGYVTGDINGNTTHQRLWGTDSVQNLIQFNPPTSIEYSTDGGTTWTATTVPSSVFSGKVYGAWSGLSLNAGGNVGRWTHVRMTWVNFGYRFFSHFTLAHSTNGHNFNFVFYKSDLEGNFGDEAFRQNGISSWPGYTFVKHSNVSGHWDTRDIRFVFELNASESYPNNAITIGHIGIMGSYGSFTRLYDWDGDRNITFANNISVGGNISVTGTVDGRDIATDGTKLDGIAANANNYSLPVATASVLGGVKKGTNISIAADGTISSTDTNTVTSVGISGDLSTGNITLAGSGATTITKSGGTITISSTDNNTTYSVFTGANASEDGTTGLVVAPRTTNRAQFLRGDGTWATPTDTNTTYTAGTGLSLSGTEFSVTANTYAAATHGHAISDVTGLQTALDGKLSTSGTAAAATVVTTIQDTAPTGTAGKLWWESDTGILKVYYGSAWVDAVPMPDTTLFYPKAGGSITGDVVMNQTLTVAGNTSIGGTISTTSHGNSSQWNTAYGWGNHADAGYIKSYTDTNTVTSVGVTGDLSTGNIIIAGSGATTVTKSGGTITISSTDTDTTYSDATTERAGLMSSTDKAKLDGIAANANNYTYTLPVAGTSIGGVKSGTDITVDASGNVSVNNDSHTHDGRYYTETEADTLLAGKLTNTWDSTTNVSSGFSARVGGWNPSDDAYWDDVLRSASGRIYTDASGRTADASGYTLDFAVPSGMKMMHISTLAWSNTGYFDVFGIRESGKALWIKRINDFQDVLHDSDSYVHAGSHMYKVEGVDRFTTIRIQGRVGRIHLQGVGWTKERGGGDAFNGFIHIDNVYSPNTIITSANIGSQSVNYATSAGSATSATSATTAGAVTGKSSISKAAHTAGADDYHLEVYAPNSGDNSKEVSIRFHQGSQYYAQLRYRSGGFRFTGGADDSLTPVYASTFNGALAGNASTATTASYASTGPFAATSHTHSDATTDRAGFMSTADKTKLDGIAANANNYTYTLPVATSTVLGGVKDGTNVNIDANGVISVDSTPSFSTVAATSTTDATGYSFRSTAEVISGEGWATALYNYNNNDGFLVLNRDANGTAHPVFHVGGYNNAGYGGWSDADSMITLVRADGTKSTGSTKADKGLSTSAYYSNIVKTTGKTIFRDIQGLHEFSNSVNVNGLLRVSDPISVNNRSAMSVAHWSNSGSPSTGAVVITLPGTHTSNWSMLVLRITSYEYNSNAHCVYYVSGHDWTSGWYNNGITKIGIGKDVRLGYNTTTNKDVVVLGDTDSTWSYGHVTVDVIAHPSFYTTAMDITTGWDARQTTDLGGYGFNDVPNRQVLDSSNVGSYALTSLPSHTHDDRYYTETETDTLLAGKAASSHTHDDRYYTETETDTLLAGKAASSHTHALTELTSIPGWFNLGNNMITNLSNFNASVPSGFYQYSGASNAPGDGWYNLINVRHSNTANDHGFQIAASYYDENIWTRTYQSGTGRDDGTFTTWRSLVHSGNIASQSVNYAATAGSAPASDVYAWAKAASKPTYTNSEVGAAAASHTHAISDVTGLQTALDGKLGSSATAASATSVVTLQDTAPTGTNGKLWWETDTGKLKVYFTDAWVDASPIPDTSLFYSRAGGTITGDVTVQQTLTVIGNVLVQGTLTETSDARLKENVAPLQDSLNKVMKLNGVSFNKIDTPEVKEVGFIAQEVEEVLPELVTETEDGIKTVSYSRVTAVLVETVKEQQAQIDELKELVNKLTEKLNSL